ncbi:DUF4230 domain-containing protein [Sandaracinobacteroides sp. A072]|uniref:DUF4230 domain-containing protein n=1 Tax=Sandaracinobacteroides sp. A072 TaxID=3461146 RepID=UPI004043764D
MRRFLAIVGAIALLAGLLLLAAGPDRRREACEAVGLCRKPDLMGAMLHSVQRQQKLVVLTARLSLPVTSARDTTVGPITVATTRQTVILPATLNYVVDLSRLTEADLDWDAEARILRVRRPEIDVLPPTIDWAQAQTYQDKGWATVVTSVSENLQRDNAGKAPDLFLRQGRAPEMLALADKAADAALAMAFRMPLLAAGHETAQVVVTH